MRKQVQAVAGSHFCFHLKFHFRAKPKDHRVTRSTADVRVMLHDRLEGKHPSREIFQPTIQEAKYVVGVSD